MITLSSICCYVYWNVETISKVSWHTHITHMNTHAHTHTHANLKSRLSSDKISFIIQKNCKKRKCTRIYDTDKRQLSRIEGGIFHTTDTIRYVIVFIYTTNYTTRLYASFMLQVSIKFIRKSQQSSTSLSFTKKALNFTGQKFINLKNYYFCFTGKFFLPKNNVSKYFFLQQK